MTSTTAVRIDYAPGHDQYHRRAYRRSQVRVYAFQPDFGQNRRGRGEYRGK